MTLNRKRLHLFLKRDLFLYDVISKQVQQLTHSIGNEWDPVFYSEDEIWFAGEFGINNGIYHLSIRP